MVDRRPLIQQIDSLLSEGLSTVNNLLYIQKLEQNDARVTFFKNINTVLNSTVVSLIIAHKHLGEEEWWKTIHSDYELSNRPYDFHREFGYFDQVNLNGTFILVFISFEHSTRLICKQYNLKLFQEKESTINGIWKGIRKDLGINNRDDFIDLITNLRNSLHNNGLFVPRGK
jgi:hypothetical protein